MGVLAWALIFAHRRASGTRQKAAEDDPGRRAVWVIAILASGFSLFATALVLRSARTSGARVRGRLFVVLCLAAVVTAWALTHTAYTLRYAHLYYRDDHDGVGGLTFPGNTPPAYFDFAYFAFTIGMCFQTADVTITSRRIRRAVMGHAVLSFAYNTTILATAVSLIVGFLGLHVGSDRRRRAAACPLLDDDLAGEVEGDVLGVRVAPGVARAAEQLAAGVGGHVPAVRAVRVERHRVPSIMTDALLS